MKNQRGSAVLVVLAAVFVVMVGCAASLTVVKLVEKQRAAEVRELRCVDSTNYKKECE